MINFYKLAVEQEKEEFRLGRVFTMEECDRSRREWLKRQGFKPREEPKKAAAKVNRERLQQ